MSRHHYLSLAQTYRSEAHRHLGRARAWLNEGKADYAAGSLRKAHRWSMRAREASQEAAKPPTLESTITVMIADRIAADFEDLILIGR